MRPVRQAAISLLLLLAWQASAFGQEVAPAVVEPYRDGPGSYLSGSPGPFWGSWTNPAASALNEGAAAGAFWSTTGTGGRVALPVLGAFTVALGGAYLTPVDDQSYARFDMDVGLDLGRAFKLGMTWQRTYGDDGFGGLDPISFGALIRPHRTLSLAFTAFNVTEEVFDEATFGPGTNLARFGGGLSVRPGTDRVRIDLQFDADRSWLRREAAAGIVGTIWPGLDLGITGRYRVTDDFADWGLGATLNVAMPYASVSGGYSYLGGRSDGFAAASFASQSEPTRLAPHNIFVVMEMPVAFAETRSARLFGPSGPSLLDFRRKLHELARDPEVEGLFLTVRTMATGWAQAQELAASLQDIRDQGKTLVVYLLGSKNQAYYLASHANKIVLNPAAALFLTGIFSRLNFYFRTLERIGITAQFAKVGTHKSFPEKYNSTEPSPEFREAHLAMLDAFFGQLVAGIAKARGMEADPVRKWIDAGPYSATQALEAGLVDRIAVRSDVTGLLGELGYNNVRLSGTYPLRQTRETEWGPKKRVAVLTVQGSIVDGRGFTIPLFGRFVGSDTIIAAIKQIGRTPGIAGLLVRVDSPGGSALGSERIHAQLKALAGKMPVIVSMGNAGASGAYYLSMAAPTIYASSGTVTGSIGIWYGKVVASGLLDKLQVDRTVFQRGKNAGLMDVDYLLSDEELAAVAVRLKDMYDLFLKRVAEGRKMSVEEVDKVAQGRVWTGEHALERKLIDAHGGSLEALQALCARIGVSNSREVELLYYPQLSFSQMLTQSLVGGASALSEKNLAALSELVESLQSTSLWAVSPVSVTTTTP